MRSEHNALNGLIDKQREIKILGTISAVLGWDQETYMPENGLALGAACLALRSDSS
jgi:Zn-dependent M32 family carboxypeptidase